MIKLAIIGFGGMGEYHFHRLKRINEYEVVGVYDIDENRMMVAQNFNLKIYSSALEVAEDKTINTVLIATPNHLHFYYVDFFAKAHKNIICEKPVALSTEEYLKMVDVCNKNNVLFTVHQNRRFDEDFLTIKEIIKSNKLGKIYKIESNVMGANGIPGGWRKQICYGGGMMLDWGVHLIDQIVNLYPNRKIESINSDFSYVLGFDVDDGFLTTLRFEDDLTVTVRVDTNSYVNLPRWIIYGRDGTAVINNWSIEGKIVLPNYDAKVEIVGIEAGNGFTKTMAYRPHSSVIEEKLPKVLVDKDIFYKNFYQALNKKEPLLIQPDGVLKVLKLMELAKKSNDSKEILKNVLL